MHYVYLIRSLSSPEKTYVGNTTNLTQRLETHNSGGSKYTQHDKPWELIMFLGFKDKLKATAFEKYLKSGSGSAFAQKTIVVVVWKTSLYLFSVPNAIQKTLTVYSQL